MRYNYGKKRKSTSGVREKRLPALHYSVIILSHPIESWILFWNFDTIRGSLMRPKWPKQASLAQKTCTHYTFSSLVYSLLPEDYSWRTKVVYHAKHIFWHPRGIWLEFSILIVKMCLTLNHCKEMRQELYFAEKCILYAA